MANIEIPLDSGDFCLMDRKVVDLLNSMPERNRFIRGLRSWVGFKQIDIEYNRESRFAGEVKYTARKLVKLALDGLIAFSHIPLRIVSIFGFVVSLLGFFGIIFVLYLRLLTETTVPGTTTIIICVLFIGGVQLIATGIGGEYIGRIYDEVKQRPQFIVRHTIGFEDSDSRAFQSEVTGLNDEKGYLINQAIQE
jgi:dolichol-phosphate mannosyltransferase